MEIVKVNNADDIPIYALRLKTKQKLSCMLNGTKVIHSPNGLPRDWRGFAELIGMDMSFASSVAHSNPMEKILIHWADNSSNCTVKQLGVFLEKLDRYDVLDDISDLIQADVAEYNCRPANIVVDRPPLCLVDESQILTVDDIARLRVGLGVQLYDAFVLYVDSDFPFALQLINNMEGYGLKLCIKDRDIVGGHNFEHETIMKLLSQRCNRLVVVLSKDFLNSYANHFFISYAQAIGIEQRKRKVIPCIYQSNVREILPAELKSCFVLDWTRSNALWNCWEKLRDSVCPVFQTDVLTTDFPFIDTATNIPSIVSNQINSPVSSGVEIVEMSENGETMPMIENGDNEKCAKSSPSPSTLVKRKGIFSRLIPQINRTTNHPNKSKKKSDKYKMQTT